MCSTERHNTLTLAMIATSVINEDRNKINEIANKTLMAKQPSKRSQQRTKIHEFTIPTLPQIKIITSSTELDASIFCGS